MGQPETPEKDPSGRRLARERKARLEAESIAERVTGELYAANGQLQVLNQTMRDFVATVSHDLRSPIATIIGSAATIMNRWEAITDEQKLNLLGAIERSGQSLSRLVDDLLTVSRIDAGQLDIYQQVINVHDTIEQLMKDFEQASEIRLKAPEGLKVLADPDHFRRILVNFIDNAFKYGSPPVDICARRTGDWTEIKVCDHGEGVPGDFMPSLFSKFARGHVRSTGQTKGIGLGLWIVQGLARANGGDVWYEPSQPHGSCFAVRLHPKAG